MTNFRSSVFTAAAIFLGSFTANAQYDPSATMDLGMAYGQIALSQSVMTNTRNIGGSASKAFSSRSTPATSARPSASFTPRSMDFSPSPAVTRKVRSEIAQSFKGSGNEALVQAIQDGAPWKDFDRLIGKYDFRSTNLIDVMTAYYILTWDVVNGQDDANNTSGIHAVRQQLLGTFANNAALGNVSDADKQEAAETFAYLGIFAATAQNEMIRRGEQSSLPQLREAVYQSVLKQGVDLRRLRLTGQGFTPG